MKQLKIKTPDDLTRENIEFIKKEMDDLKNRVLSKSSNKNNNQTMCFESIEECMKYYDAIPFDEFNEKFRKGEQE